MMRPIVLNVPTEVPFAPVLTATAAETGPVALLWTDPTAVDYVNRTGFGDPKAEIGFRIERADGYGPFQLLDLALANATTFVDASAAPGSLYQYRVTAYNASGEAVSNVVKVGPLDTLPPVVTATVSPAANAAGWNNQATTVTLSAVDPVDPAQPTSGVASITYTVNGAPSVTVTGDTVTLPSSLFPEGVSTITFFATDRAGNVTTPSTTTSVNIDRTLPTLTWAAKAPAANAAGWNNTPVTIAYTAADNLSGVASSVPGSPVSFSAEGANQTQTVTVTDVAGNSAVFTSPSVSIDLTPPAVTANAVPAFVTRGNGTRTVRVSGTITDALSRAVGTGTWRLTDSKSATVVTGTFTINATTGAYSFQRNISRSNTGLTPRIYTFTVTGTDNAGNVSTATTRFTVL